MSQSSISYSQLAATLAVDGAISMIAGTTQGKAPVESVTLSPEERIKLGVGPAGATLFFPAGGPKEDGVFFDLNGDKATLWYNGGDCEVGMQALEAALKKAHPTARYLGEAKNVKEPTMLTRVYEVALGDGKSAVIEASFPGSTGGKRQFAVRIFAKQTKR